MKKILLFLILLSSVLILSWEAPDYDGRLNDYINLFSSSEKNQIQKIIDEIEEKTTAEIAVVSLYKEDDIYPDDMAIKIFDKWKIGKKDVDNGLLLLFVIDKEGKSGGSRIKIQVGYGLEGILPDGKVGRFIDDYMMDYLKDKKYGKATISILNRISDELSNDISIITKIKENPVVIPIGFAVLIVILVIVINFLSIPKCSNCNKRMKQTQNEIIRRSTYTVPGKGIRHYRCKHCGFEKSIPYVIPVRTKSSSNGGSSGGGSSSSGGFGGGSSGGGGAGRNF